MTFADLIPRSTLVINGCIRSGSAEALEGFIGHNLTVFRKFRDKALVFNIAPGTDSNEVKSYISTWQNIFPTILINGPQPNRGHQIGAMDLEEASLNACKIIGNDFMWKLSDDWLIHEKSLNISIRSYQEPDFFYLPSLSKESILLRKHKEFLPQTNFYIVNVKKLSTLYGDITTYYQKLVKAKLSNSEIKLWDILHGWKLDCETTLAKHITDQYLQTFNILREERFDKLITFVDSYNVGDPSHKNIFFEEEGLCHFHFKDQGVFYI